MDAGFVEGKPPKSNSDFRMAKEGEFALIRAKPLDSSSRRKVPCQLACTHPQNAYDSSFNHYFISFLPFFGLPSPAVGWHRQGDAGQGKTEAQANL